ncbi:MAG: hypothetical protein AAF585_04810 [Verrucomicrobiota bacterium]
MEFEFEKLEIEGGRGVQVSILLNVREVYHLFGESADFRSSFCDVLLGCGFDAFFWETPPAAADTLNEHFECVVLESTSLARLTPNSFPFSNQFAAAEPDEEVIVFTNLGGDATLVVPCPLDRDSAYPHFAEFLRTAPESQKHALWIQLSAAFQRRVSEKPVWVSTAGMGVSWLHLRLDDRPKYYRHRAYAEGWRRNAN